MQGYSLIIRDFASTVTSQFDNAIVIGGVYTNLGDMSVSIGSQTGVPSQVGSSAGLTHVVKWSSGIVLGQPFPFDWTFFEYLATSAAETSDYDFDSSWTGNGYKVTVFDNRLPLTIDTNDVRLFGQLDDNGRSLAVFKGTADVTLVDTSDGRGFGPTILAPFAAVISHSMSIGGTVIALSFTSTTTTHIRGDAYYGPLPCSTLPEAPPASCTNEIKTKKCEKKQQKGKCRKRRMARICPVTCDLCRTRRLS